MKKLTRFSAFLIALALVQPAMAAERPDHFEGKQSETLEQAVANFAEYNHRLAELLDQKTLDAADLQTVHQLTYTLENALEKIRHEFAALAETLEEIHVASETADAEAVKSRGRVYLDTAAKVVE